MERHSYLPGPTERVKEDEVRALIERFGEESTRENHSDPTVADVAETLQLEPEAVGAMLQQIRQAKDEDDLKETLDRLERENVKLLRRTGEIRIDFGAVVPDSGKGVHAVAAVVLALLTLMVVKNLTGSGIWAFAAFGTVIVVALLLSGRRRR